MGLFSWIRNAFSPPLAFMYRPGLSPGAKVRLYWSVPQLDVHIEPGSMDALAGPLADATGFWNSVIGRRFFAPPMEAIDEVLKAFADPVLRAGMKGQILVRCDGGDRDHGQTQEEYRRKTGEMISAVVTLPFTSNRLLDVTRHECGHVLCLDHAAEGTLMAARLPPPDGKLLPLAPYQAKAVKAMVG